MTTLKSRLPIIFLLCGATLRIATLGSSAIWYDESITLYRTTIPFLQLFTNHSENSGDLLLELILRVIMPIAPHSLWLLRLPSLLAGLISLWLAYMLMQRMHFSFYQQLVSSLFIAFLPGVIWVSQDGRPYVLLGCLFLAGLLFAWDGKWLGLTACCGLMIYVHSTGPACAIAALIIAWCMQFQTRKLIVSGVAVFLTWLPAMLRIAFNGGVWHYAWGSKPTLEVWVVSGFASAWVKIPTVMFFAGCTLMLVTLYFLRWIKKDKAMIQLFAWLIPLIVLAGFSIYRNVIIYRTLMPLLIPFFLWLCWELTINDAARRYRIVLLIGWAAMLVYGSMIYSPVDRGGRMDQVSAQIRSRWQAGDELVYATSTVGLPMEYYLGDLPQRWLDIAKDPMMDVPGVPRPVRPCVGTCKREWVVIPNEDDLITPIEWQQLDQITQGHAPVYSVKYMQAATINVYLIEE